MHNVILTINNATISAALSTPDVFPLPWIVQLWNAPGFSQLVSAISGGIIVAIYKNIQQEKIAVSDKRKDVAENILEPFIEFFIECHVVDTRRDVPLMERAIMTDYYTTDIDQKEFIKQLKKAKTLAKLYAPNYIQGEVDNLAILCQSMF